MLRTMDAQYTIGNQSLKTVAYKSMPAEVRKRAGSELATGPLPNWKPMRDFRITFSDSTSVTHAMKPALFASELQLDEGTRAARDVYDTPFKCCSILKLHLSHPITYVFAHT